MRLLPQLTSQSLRQHTTCIAPLVFLSILRPHCSGDRDAGNGMEKQSSQACPGQAADHSIGYGALH